MVLIAIIESQTLFCPQMIFFSIFTFFFSSNFAASLSLSLVNQQFNRFCSLASARLIYFYLLFSIGGTVSNFIFCFCNIGSLNSNIPPPSSSFFFFSFFSFDCPIVLSKPSLDSNIN